MPRLQGGGKLRLRAAPQRAICRASRQTNYFGTAQLHTQVHYNHQYDRVVFGRPRSVSIRSRAVSIGVVTDSAVEVNLISGHLAVAYFSASSLGQVPTDKIRRS
jgi:hypothetical protein